MPGKRSITVATTPTDSLSSLWGADDKLKVVTSILDQLVPENSTYGFKVLNLFALIDGLVQPLTSEYNTKQRITLLDLNGTAIPKPRLTLYDPRIEFNRKSLMHDPSSKINTVQAANGTIIADTAFNEACYKTTKEPMRALNASSELESLDLDLTERSLNEALQKIALSVMYTLDWWHSRTNTTQTSYQNVFSFSSRPRLVVPYAASLLAALPFL